MHKRKVATIDEDNPSEMKRVHLCPSLGGKMNRHNKLCAAVLGVAPQKRKKKNVCLKKKNVVNILKHTKNIFHLLLAGFVSDSATANCEREERRKRWQHGALLLSFERYFHTKAQRERIFSFS